MFDAYKAESRSVADLLSDSLKGTVVVPKFQRGYSWTKKHVQAFWEDIVHFQKESETKNGPDWYFLGPIVVRQPEDNRRITYILDGQQRLATATILFSVLRDLAYGLNTTEGISLGDDIHNHLISKSDYGYSLQMGDLDKDFFETSVQQKKPAFQKPTIRSHHNILKAREALLSYVKAALPSDPADAHRVLDGLRTVVRRDLIMAAIPVKSERDAFRIFETLNDRGLKLSVPDLLLNFLMGAAENDNQRARIRKHWDSLVEGMGKKDPSIFLRHIWVSKYGDLKKEDLFSALKKHIEDRQIKSVDFAKACAEDCAIYLELLKPRTEHLGEAAGLIETLVNDLEFDVTMPLLLSAHSTMTNQNLAKVARLLLVFVTRYTMLLGLDFSGLENTMYALAREIRPLPQGKAVAHIKSALLKRSPDNTLILAMRADGEEMILEPQDAVYIVSRIARKLQTSTRELTLDESNLEHIFPKNPSAEWTNRDDLEPYLWHIGNLTWLGKRLNESIGNAGYATKRPYYKKSSELKITQKLADEYQEWNVSSIEQRGKKMVEQALEIWSFDNPSNV